MIQAVTFDFWDTIAVDDSDERKRARLGLPSKSAERMQLFVDHIVRHYPHIERKQAEAAYRQANARFQAEWHEHQRTPGVHRRLSYAYESLGLRPAPGRYAAFLREVNELAHAIETMEVRIAPDFAPHIHAVIAELSQHYALGIVSDTIHTNGRGIRHLLYQQGLLHYFRFFLFSDEVGVSKPSAQIFRRAALELGLSPALIAHIGDREQNDVLGPLSVGMRAILYTGIVDRGSHCTRAHAVCRDFRQLPSLLRRMT